MELDRTGQGRHDTNHPMKLKQCHRKRRFVVKNSHRERIPVALNKMGKIIKRMLQERVCDFFLLKVYLILANYLNSYRKMKRIVLINKTFLIVNCNGIPVIYIFGDTDMLILLPSTNIYCEVRQWPPHTHIYVYWVNNNSRPNCSNV